MRDDLMKYDPFPLTLGELKREEPKPSKPPALWTWVADSRTTDSDKPKDISAWGNGAWMCGPNEGFHRVVEPQGVTYDELIEASKPDAEGWIKNTTGTEPANLPKWIDIRFRGGLVLTSALPMDWAWGEVSCMTIAEWRPSVITDADVAEADLMLESKPPLDFSKWTRDIYKCGLDGLVTGKYENVMTVSRPRLSAGTAAASASAPSSKPPVMSFRHWID